MAVMDIQKEEDRIIIQERCIIMKIDKQLILPIALILTFSIYLGINNTGKMNYNIPDFITIEEDQLDTIEINRSSGSIKLYLDKGIWKLEHDNLRANPSKIKEMLSFLVKPEFIDMVSDSGNYQSYGLEENNYISVKAWTNTDSNKILARELLIGNTNTTGNFTFIRRPDIEKVFTVSENRKDLFDITINDLLDKRILNNNIPDIDKIILSFTHSSYSLKKSVGNNNEDIWSFSDGSAIEMNDIEKNLRYLSNSRFNTYIDNKDIVSSKMLFKIDLFEENLNDSFTILEKRDEGYYCKSSYTDKYFILSENTGTELIKMFKELLEKKED